MDSTQPRVRRSGRVRGFVPADTGAACAQWQSAAERAGAAAGAWRCEPLADASPGRLRGYRVTSPQGPASERWMDSEVWFPVRVRTAAGVTVLLMNLRAGAQPQSLFQVPPGSRRLDPQALIERIRRSDVWAAAEN